MVDSPIAAALLTAIAAAVPGLDPAIATLLAAIASAVPALGPAGAGATATLSFWGNGSSRMTMSAFLRRHNARECQGQHYVHTHIHTYIHKIPKRKLTLRPRLVAPPAVVARGEVVVSARRAVPVTRPEVVLLLLLAACRKPPTTQANHVNTGRLETFPANSRQRSVRSPPHPP